jgi:hypothetical protein
MRIAILCCVALAAVGCDSESGGTTYDLAPVGSADLAGGDTDMQARGTVMVSGEITTNTTWTADNDYLLTSQVFVRNGATLTIEPGTVVKGQAGTYILVAADGKINAVGTKDEPIIMTSAKAPGSRRSSDWGGVVLLGRASINVAGGKQTIEFLNNDPRGEYGGNDDSHDCGKMKYVQIEFAGFAVLPDKELNGLSLAGCGSATEIDYVHVHRASDDGVEIWGGTVNVKHVIVTMAEDDSLDWDQGWRGKAQFMILGQMPNVPANFGIEADGNRDNNQAQPFSRPTIYNMTFVGTTMETTASGKNDGAIFRRGTGAIIANSIFTKAGRYPIDVTDPFTAYQVSQNNLKVTNTIFFGNGKQGADWDDAQDASCGTASAGDGKCDGSPCLCVGSAASACAGMTLTCGAGTLTCSAGNACNGTVVQQTPFNEGAVFLASENANLTSDPMLTAPSTPAAPSYKPMAGSPALTAQNAAPKPNDPFFEDAPFLGAVGATDWTEGWATYPEN